MAMFSSPHADIYSKFSRHKNTEKFKDKQGHSNVKSSRGASIVFVVLSGLNYFYYYERTESLNAPSREAMHSVVTNPLGVIVTSEKNLKQSPA